MTASLAPNSLLAQVVAHLDRSGVERSRFPDRKGEYWAHCPFHADKHPNNFSVSTSGYRCFACGAQGGLRALAEKLGIERAGQGRLHGCTRNGRDGGYSLEQYGRDKGLPLDFLKGLGLTDRKFGNRPAVRIPYLDATGQEVGARFRIAAQGDKFRWTKGAKVQPYGLERLDRGRGYVYLVEGESDAQTLWFYGEPALGIPGAATWKAEWAECVAGLTVYVWQEPDEGGGTFVRSVAASAPGVKVLRAPQGRKDISDCHLKQDDVPELLARLRKDALDGQAVLDKATAARAAEARRKAGKLVSAPDLLDRFAEICRAQGLVGEEKTARLLYLALTSRLLPRPVSIAVKGPSSGGKSFTVETVLKAFPASAFYALSAMSDRSLAYSEEPMQHRMLVLYEAAGLSSDFASYLMRSLLSEGRIDYDTVESTPGGIKPRHIFREGPTGLITTTTAPSLHPENETRLFSVTVQDTPRQTTAVLAALAERASGATPQAVDLAPWQALQEWLALGGKREVVIPFARRIAELTAGRGVRLRRDFGATLALIQAHALLHQETRPRDHQGRIVATLADYAAVYELVIDIVSQGVQASVAAEVREVVAAVKALDMANGLPVTFKRVGERLGIDRSAAKRRCEVALREGYLINRQDKRNQPAALGPGEPLPGEERILPAPDEVAGEVPPEPAQPCNRSDGAEEGGARKTSGVDLSGVATPDRSGDSARETSGVDLSGVATPDRSGDAPEPWQQSFLDEAGGALWELDSC